MVALTVFALFEDDGAVVDGYSAGANDPENLQRLCGSCNSIKGPRDMDYLRRRLEELEEEEPE